MPERLISELLIELPERVPQGRLRPQPLQGRHRAREDPRRVRRHAPAPGVLRRRPEASFTVRCRRCHEQQSACYLGMTQASERASRTSMAVLLPDLAAQPGRPQHPGTTWRRSAPRHGSGSRTRSSCSCSYPHDRLPQHGDGDPGRLRIDHVYGGEPPRRLAAGRLPGRRDLQERRPAPPAWLGRREVLRPEDPNLASEQPGRRAARDGASSPRDGMRLASRPPWKPRPQARTGPAWWATWCSTSSPPSRGSPRARN